MQGFDPGHGLAHGGVIALDAIRPQFESAPGRGHARLLPLNAVHLFKPHAFGFQVHAQQFWPQAGTEPDDAERAEDVAQRIRHGDLADKAVLLFDPDGQISDRFASCSDHWRLGQPA
ncbi:hypothetical protein D3C78_1343760 [compost metagenome]